jgi:hypothetical protein
MTNPRHFRSNQYKDDLHLEVHSNICVRRDMSGNNKKAIPA